MYAAKFPSPPPELNTLVPEDFNLIDFNFNDLNHKHKEEVIKTDNHFIVESTKENPVAEVVNETTVKKVDSVTQSSDAGTSVIAATAVVTTTAILSTIEEEKDNELKPVIKTEAPVKETTPIAAAVVEEPLKKVSEARKSLEPSKTTTEKEIYPAPIVMSEAPKNVEPSKSVEKQQGADSVSVKHSEPEVIAAPIIIKEAPKERTEEIKTESAVVTEVKKEPEIFKTQEPIEVEEISAPPPLPTNNAHLVAVRESLKPSLLPVKPVNGAPSNDPDAPRPQSSTSPLANSGISAAELEQLKKELEQQKLALEREIDNKKALEAQIQAIISKSNAQEEALKYKNESLEQLHSDYLKINNDLTSARNEKEKLEVALVKAEEELATISETNAKAYLEKSDEVTALKDKLAEFAAIIGLKNKEIDSLQRQLDEVKRSNVNTALENVQQYEILEEELVKMVEEEILRMQDTIDEQREYNAKLQMEVDAEYAYWKRRLAEREQSKQE